MGERDDGIGYRSSEQARLAILGDLRKEERQVGGECRGQEPICFV